jgi:antitoxin component of MazEF toxin-antitoxin module
MELEPDVQFEVRGEGGAILLIPVSTQPTLANLLEKVTPENLHGEVDMGQSAGDEAW